MTRYIIIIAIILITSQLLSWPFLKNQTNKSVNNLRIITIMIDPAGDAKNTGRVIEDSFERGITLQCAQEIKQLLESQIKNIRVILTRFPGETLEPLQNASFANRLQVDFYLSIHFYQSAESINKIYIYHMLYNKVTDFWQQKNTDLSFQPYDTAHRTSIKKSVEWGNLICDNLRKSNLSCQSIVGIPFNPLIGISAPAIAIEMGLHTKNDFKNIINPLSQALISIINQVQQEKSHESDLLSDTIN
jgi:N-acetylmuramoyl-L-alanine amidase